jgi:hypothetical protein
MFKPDVPNVSSEYISGIRKTCKHVDAKEEVEGRNIP